jgi:hypothetical protein
MAAIESLRARLSHGLVIPACPLALTSRRRLDERRQRALLRYYLAAGAGGVAVGVHTTQFAIRDTKVGLLEPVLELAAEEMGWAAASQSRAIGGGSEAEDRKEFSLFHSPPERERRPVRIAGICGSTRQAVREAELAAALGYEAGLLSLGALREAREDELVAHCRILAEVIPLFGFYLQPAVGGRVLSYSFWRRFADIEDVVAIKIAPFNRYQTLDVVRAAAEAGREDIALYTGNDDTIVWDLLTPYRIHIGRRVVERRIVGGLLGHWAVWTRRAVELHAECRRVVSSGEPVSGRLLRQAMEVTDSNAAFFDAGNHFAGCIPGLHEILRRQGLLTGVWCLNPCERLSPGQREEIDRVCRAYPHLSDDEFVSEHRDDWLRG